MSYYEQRLIVDLQTIREGVFDLGMQVDHALRDSVRALLTRDTALASQTIMGDHPINREAERLSMECHYFIAKHLPSASHLRFISSALRMIIHLERMGDYAVTICRESVQLSVPLSGVFREQIEEMAADALKMCRQALEAYVKEDYELAHETMGFAKRVDQELLSAYHLLADENMPDLDKPELLGRLVIISQLDRVSDQAKNLCEETIFALTGETKKRRPVKVLFLDAGNESLAYLALAIGEKEFSDRAECFAYSPNESEELRNHVNEFIASHGLETVDLKSRELRDSTPSWQDYDVIITLNGSHSQYLDRIPFHSVALDWWIPDSSEEEDRLEDARRFLRDCIENVVLTCRGETPATG